MASNFEVRVQLVEIKVSPWDRQREEVIRHEEIECSSFSAAERVFDDAKRCA